MGALLAGFIAEAGGFQVFICGAWLAGLGWVVSKVLGLACLSARPKSSASAALTTGA
jgi:hypothetical protein